MNRIKKKHATINDVAKDAGVAISTASCILRNVDSGWKISDATRKRVFDSAKKLNYRASMSARSLVNRRSENIGFLMPLFVPDKWRNRYFSGLLCGAERVAHDKGYSLVIGRYDETNINDLVLPEHVRQRAVDGVILTGYASSRVIRQFHEQGVVCVSTGANIEIKDQIRSVPGGCPDLLIEALSYLISIGHRRIWLVCKKNMTRAEKESYNILSSRIRQLAGKYGVDLMCFERLPEGTEEDVALSVLRQWLSMPGGKRPTAIIMDSSAAMVFIVNLKKYNLSCPSDISVIAVGDKVLSKNYEVMVKRENATVL